MESYEKIKKVLALGFMNFLDDNKPKGKMCLSNGECEDIEKAFNEQDWPRLARYLDKFILHKEEQEWENPKEDVQTRFAFYTYKDEPEVVYLSNVFVEESSRHQGLGTRILEAAEMVAKTYGATAIRLRVRPDSPAKVWYLNHGYIYMTFQGEYQWLEKYI